MNIMSQYFRNRILGCWMGKNIGGTLGEPFEWKRQVNDINYFIQELKGEPLPNDDLDIQLLWLDQWHVLLILQLQDLVVLDKGNV